MSRSSQPRSNIVERVRKSSPLAGRAPVHRRSLARRLAIRLAAVMLWLHIYMSMFGLAAVLFFSLTGLTLNHPDWFAGAASTVEAEGQIDRSWLHLAANGADDPSAQVDKLQVVEQLRQAHAIRGALTDFRVDDVECSLSFKGPGYDADALIDRDSGGYRLTQSFQGLVAILNDLHKGRDTGKPWSLVIDISAVVLTLISLTGLVLLFYLRRRRLRGLLTASVGTAVIVAIIFLWVP